MVIPGRNYLNSETYHILSKWKLPNWLLTERLRQNAFGSKVPWKMNRSQVSVFLFYVKFMWITLAGVAQWIEHQTGKQSVAGLIPSQGTCLGCGPGPQWGLHKRQPHTDVSLPLLLPPFPSV